MAVPQHHPSPRELDDLELLLSGAYAPVTGFNEPGSPITLALPAELEELAPPADVELVDPEGLPLAVVTVQPGGWPVRPLSHAEHGPFRRLYLTPDQVREQHAGRIVVPVSAPVTERQLAELARLGPVLLLALVGTGTPELSPVALVRATLAVAAELPDAVVVAVPLPSHGDVAVDHDLGVHVAHLYAVEDPVHALVDDPDGELPAAVEAIVAQDRPGPGEQGLVLFFTGLSGSGKSTLARALLDRVLERGGRSVTSLDGDVVRRNLSAGLSFSREDRETNIRRIGWVAAEISRHGGIALCSPIAPFDETRQQVREMVRDAGGAFFLVHVATPVEECERRDRKGLYAKARRGEIPEFTGISSPYEAPQDADVRVDTTGRSIEECLEEVVEALAGTGHLDLREPVPGGTAGDAGPLRVLFVCTANISRSPAMELEARRLLGPGSHVEVTSAGIRAMGGRAMDPEMVALLDDPTVAGPHRSRLLDRTLIDEADLVLTAEASHRSFILEEHPDAMLKVFTLGQFAAAVERDGAGLTGRELVAHVSRHRGPADAAHDVTDPYRLGPQAARAAMQRIRGYLDPVLARLAGRA